MTKPWNVLRADLPPPDLDARLLLRSKDGKKGFETISDIKEEKLTRIKSLRKRPKARAHLLANRLEADGRRKRFVSMASPFYAARARLWLLEQMLLTCRDDRACQEQLQFVTLIDDDWIVPATDLAAVSPRRITDQVRHQFLRSGIDSGAVVIGSMHGEYDKVREYWQPHVHLERNTSFIRCGSAKSVETHKRRHSA